MELIEDPLEEGAVQMKSFQVENFSIVLTREEFLETMFQLQEENKMERRLELEETWSTILRVNAHVKANAAQGLLNKNKILRLEEKIGKVQKEQQVLKYEVKSTSMRFESLRRRMMEEIPEIPENEITNTQSNNIVKKNANDKKWNSRNRRTINSDRIKPLCDICKQGFFSKSSLKRHVNRIHSRMGKDSSPTMRTQYQAKLVPKEESEINKRRFTRSFSCDKGALKRAHFNGELSCPFCNYWAYGKLHVKKHMKKIHGNTEDMGTIPILSS